MTTRRFILHVPDKRNVRSACLAFVAELDFDNPYQVTVEPYSPDRGLDANSFYWVGIIAPAGKHFGYSSKEMHTIVCMELYGVREVSIGGKLFPMPVRTTTSPKTMSKAEFSLHCEMAAAFVVGHGAKLPT